MSYIFHQVITVLETVMFPVKMFLYTSNIYIILNITHEKIFNIIKPLTTWKKNINQTTIFSPCPEVALFCVPAIS